MAGPDVAFLYGETETWHMHVSGVLLVDASDAPGFGPARLADIVADRLPQAPQLGWKVRSVPLGLGRPYLVEDPDFRPESHVHHIAVPPPGDRTQLGVLIGDLAARKLDRSRPLWEMWVIEGLEDGRVAILAKIHHAIVDGVSGADLLTLLLDHEPRVPAARTAPGPVDDRAPTRGPSDLELLARGVADAATVPWRAARLVPQVARQAVTVARFQSRPEKPPMVGAPRTSLNRAISPHRRFAFTALDLAAMREVRRAFDVKLNDVVLAVVSGALRGHLLDEGGLPDQSLVAQVPVSMRSEGDTHVGTKVANMMATLHTDLDDPGERLLAIHTGTQRSKELQQALAAHHIMSLPDTAPPAMITLASRSYSAAGLDGRVPPMFNLIVSNVPGPPVDLYLGGARVVGAYPMGPLLFGSGINVTVLSKAATMDVGLLACRENLPDPWPLVDRFPEALDELVSAARARPPG
jgi:diacylglycerol O-acyltransferase